MVPEQPAHGVVAATTLLARREREYQSSFRYDLIPLHAEQRFGECRRAILDVARPTSVEKAIAFRELVRVERPVRAQRFNDVEVRDEQNRLEHFGRALHANYDA